MSCSAAVLCCLSTNGGLGDVDPFFDPNLNGGVSVAVAQPDGRILIGGSFTEVNGTNRPGFARLHPDGTLDTSSIQQNGRAGSRAAWHFVQTAASLLESLSDACSSSARMVPS